jgi:hypothetical protein
MAKNGKIRYSIKAVPMYHPPGKTLLINLGENP